MSPIDIPQSEEPSPSAPAAIPRRDTKRVTVQIDEQSEIHHVRNTQTTTPLTSNVHSSHSAPHFESTLLQQSGGGRAPRTRASTVSRSYNIAPDKDISEDQFRYLVRSYTRRSSSLDRLDSRKERRNSQIADDQVLKLIQDRVSEGGASTGIQLNEEVKDLPFEEVSKKDPSLAERVRSQRMTMEGLDIFSPDARQDRIGELFEASERYISTTGKTIVPGDSELETRKSCSTSKMNSSERSDRRSSTMFSRLKSIKLGGWMKTTK